MTYGAAIQTAKAVLGRKGKRVAISRKNAGAIDPLAGTRAAGGDKSAVFNVIGLPPGRSAEAQIGSLVERKLMMFYMARVSGTIQPQPGDLVPWGGANWSLIWTATYDPDDSGVIFTQAYGEIA